VDEVIKMPEKTCSMCNKLFFLHEHKSGLVFEDRFFVCEECCDNHTEEEIIEWTRSTMQSPRNGMPVALWMIHEQNRDKPLFTKKK
jgi:hypothetical protein